MEKLPKRFKSKFVKALMSGEYKQGDTYLYCDWRQAHCCLGVACRVAGYNPPSMESFIPSSYTDVPKALRGLRIQRALAKINDHGVPFEVIAGVIHENL